MPNNERVKLTSGLKILGCAAFCELKSDEYCLPNIKGVTLQATNIMKYLKIKYTKCKIFSLIQFFILTVTVEYDERKCKERFETVR